MLTRRLALIACGTAVPSLAVGASGHASGPAVKTNHVTFSGAVDSRA